MAYYYQVQLYVGEMNKKHHKSSKTLLFLHFNLLPYLFLSLLLCLSPFSISLLRHPLFLPLAFL